MEQDSLKQIFQQQFSKMVAVISKLYGLEHIEIAEDLVSETFLLASETWGIKGVPENPVAWLYTVAKQKTLYHFRRNKIYQEKVIPQIQMGTEIMDEADAFNFSDQNIRDSQLQMMFAVCNEAIASEAQMGLALRILCGFGIEEIAEAFLSNKETINKRLFRAKEKLRTEKISMELPSEDQIVKRLDNVLHIVYLLFNEGYYSKTQNQILRRDFCLEALRLGLLLTDFERTNVPKTNALLALMCFHASRFEARETGDDNLVLHEQQDESLWDQQLIGQGLHFLARSMQGNEVTSYHIEAQIAYWHCIKEDSPQKWKSILQLYDALQTINYSPGVALNRAFVLSKVAGKQAALAEAEKLNLLGNHFYFLLLGELYTGLDTEKALAHYHSALDLAKTKTEKKSIREKMEALRLG